jgi:phage/plasmid-like protein (TIGR03299 family)
MSIIQNAFNGIKVQDINNTEAVVELLDKYNLRWAVSKQPLFLEGGAETQFFGIVRDDTNQVFQTCKASYVPYQNSELAELLIRISQQGGYRIHSGGEFNGGAKVYLQLESGNILDGIGNNRSKVNGYVSGLTSHDGTNALKWGNVNFTICCRNTFASAARTLQNTAKHTNSMQKRIDQYLADIGVIVESEKQLFQTFKRFDEIPATPKSIAKVVRIVTGVDVNATEHERENYSTYQINRTEELLSSIATETSSKGQTMWGLFSGITHYTSHVMPVAKRDNARLESKYVGSGLRIDNDVFEMLIKESNLN